MKGERRARLEAAGWVVGDVQKFLGLSDEERAFIETKLALAHGVRARRDQQGLSQVDLAKHLGSSQSRVAKMEGADASVSLDLLVRSLFRLGATRADVARLIRRATDTAA